MATKKELWVPFNDDGSMIDYMRTVDTSKAPASKTVMVPAGTPGASAWPNGKWFKREPAGEWRQNYEFDATLVVESIERGRSAARFILRDEDQRKFIMFMTDTLAMIQQAETIAYGHVEGRWTFVKRGANYGVKLV